ncbi:MAG: glycosyltransferase [Clostridia bacterium]|nr:glycosyltransferase [Clostridia bacterium]
MVKNLVSVIMGIYNCADTLPEAIECILNQTYTNWELIMCDDGSTDDTYNVAKKYMDKYPDKIMLIRNKKNLGLNETLNNCLQESHGEFIARMDGDDLCSPNRFEKEIEMLNQHPEFAIVSSNMVYFDEHGVFGRSYLKEYPQAKDIVKGTPHCHAPCMVRREAYDAVGGYSVDRRLLRAEDYDLWIKMYAKGYRGYNLSETLYSMRDDRNATGRRKFKYRLNEAYVRVRAIKILELKKYNILYAIKPVIVGLMPVSLYNILHRERLKQK